MKKEENYLELLETVLMEMQPYFMLAVEAVRFLRGGLSEIQQVPVGVIDVEDLRRRLRDTDTLLARVKATPRLTLA